MKRVLVVLIVCLAAMLCGCSVIARVITTGMMMSMADAKQTTKTQEGAGNLDDYGVQILGAKKSHSSEDGDIVTITYRWTNHSQDTVSFMDVFDCCVFQDGIELHTTMATDDLGSMPDDDMTRIKPGKTLEFSLVYALRSDTPEIDVEISNFELFSRTVIQKTFTLE